MINSFVLGGSLTGWGFAARAEQLAGCCGSLRRMRVWLGACGAGLSPQ